MSDQIIEGTFSPEYLDWRRLRRTVEESGGDPAGVFIYLAKLLDGDRWTALEKENGAPFRSFREFVADDARGLGMETAEFLKLLDVHGAAEKSGTYADTVDFEKVRSRVRDLLSENGNPVGRPPKTTRNTINYRPDDAAAVTARLKREDPDLAQQVINGEISAHAAALRKGYRKPRIVLSNPTSVAAQVRKHFTDYEIRDLINELGELL